MIRKITLVCALVAALLVAGCQGKTHQSAQAKFTDTTGADVSQMPTGFRNFADKCDGHGHRVYVTSSGGDNGKWSSGIAAVADASCR